MPCLSIEITENGRGRLGGILWIMNWLSAGASVFIAAMGIYFKLKVEDKTSLIEGYNNNVLPWMLTVVGFLCAILFLAGGRICHCSGQAHTRAKFKGFLRPYLVFLMVIVVLIIASGSMCFAHRDDLQHSLRKGIEKAMERYKDNSTYKTEIDYLQMDFECCGNNDYDDWFAVSWINNKYLNMDDAEVKAKMSTGHYLNDDVPFSCCDPRAKRPCIHHHVTDNNEHYNYDFNVAMTIHQRGCKQALSEYFSRRLAIMGSILMSMFVAQLIVLIATRYLQTSIYTASAADNHTLPSPGWLFEDVPLNCVRISKSVRDEGIKETVTEAEKCLVQETK
ncbi:photoreceptor outer segment membrane glycoprotein 2-like [Glandiceps talaboti]